MSTEEDYTATCFTRYIQKKKYLSFCGCELFIYTFLKKKLLKLYFYRKLDLL